MAQPTRSPTEKTRPTMCCCCQSRFGGCNFQPSPPRRHGGGAFPRSLRSHESKVSFTRRGDPSLKSLGLAGYRGRGSLAGKKKKKYLEALSRLHCIIGPSRCLFTARSNLWLELAVPGLPPVHACWRCVSHPRPTLYLVWANAPQRWCAGGLSSCPPSIPRHRPQPRCDIGRGEWREAEERGRERHSYSMTVAALLRLPASIGQSTVFSLCRSPSGVVFCLLSCRQTCRSTGMCSIA